jgi:hypothetical protein
MEPQFSTGQIILMVLFFLAAAIFFICLGKACLGVKSFETTLREVASGKEKNIFLRLMFLGSNTIFKWHYEWELKMVGDRVMTAMIHILAYVCFLASAMGPLGGGVFFIFQNS